MSGGVTVSWRRLRALCVKEVRQILRDPSSGIIAFLLPLVLLVIFGYGINLDSSGVRLGVLDEDGGADSTSFVSRLTGSSYFRVTVEHDRAVLDRMLERGEVRGYVAIASDFSRRLDSPGDSAPVQVITDGTEPNTANFVSAYVAGAWREWQRARSREHGVALVEPVSFETRQWFNPAAESRLYIIPGTITIIMTVIGAMLTSLVVAREWERGTMEALLASPVTRAELLLSKLLPYYALGMISMAVVTLCAVFPMGVPFRGSVMVLLLVSSLFLLAVLGVGLLISTRLRSQFNSAQTALNVAFLPAVMLSGAFFEIASMPAPVRAVTYLLPPRYFVSALQTLFLAGEVWSVLWPNLTALGLAASLFLFLVARSTTRRLDAS